MRYTTTDGPKKPLNAIQEGSLGGKMGIAEATPFTFTTQLTGDIRPENPDELFVNVTIAGDTDSDNTYWLVDVESPNHPDVKLDQFYFNLALNGIGIDFTDFMPNNWDIQSPGNAQGAGTGNTLFNFVALDPPPIGQGTTITNNISLTFTATLLGGYSWTQAMFNDALEVSGDAGSGQLGAHLKSLEIPEGETSITSDSGFVFGNYTPVPEPATMLLFGTGLAGLAAVGRRRKN